MTEYTAQEKREILLVGHTRVSMADEDGYTGRTWRDDWGPMPGVEERIESWKESRQAQNEECKEYMVKYLQHNYGKIAGSIFFGAAVYFLVQHPDLIKEIIKVPGAVFELGTPLEGGLM